MARWKTMVRSFAPALVAVMFAAGKGEPASAQQLFFPPNGTCSVVGAVANCSGDLSDVFRLAPPIETLVIRDASGPVGREDGGTTFRFDADGPVHIDADVRTFGILSARTGFELNNRGNDGVAIKLLGDIITPLEDGFGSEFAAVDVFDALAGNIELDISGDIQRIGIGGEGIVAEKVAGSGNIFLSYDGNITIEGNARGAILLRHINANGDIEVNFNGDIDAIRGAGISAESDGNGQTTIVANGNISAGAPESAISAIREGNGDIDIEVSGSVTANTFRETHGIFANGKGAGDISIVTDADISAFGVVSNAVKIVEEGPGNIAADLNGSHFAGFVDDDGLLFTESGAGNIDVSVSGKIGAALIISSREIETAGIRAISADIGATRIMLQGDIEIPGPLGIGIVAGNTGVGDVSVSFERGEISADSGIRIEAALGRGIVEIGTDAHVRAESGFAVDMQASVESTLDIAPGALVSTQNDTAISGETGLLTVSNSGTIFGDLTNHSGDVALTNQAAGSFDGGISASGVVDFTNHGTFDVGGSGAREPVAFNGRFEQSSEGSSIFEFGADPTDRDHLLISGTADLSGTIDLRMSDLEVVGLFPIVTADGGIAANGVALGTVDAPPNPLISVDLQQSSENELSVLLSFDVELGDLNVDQTAVMDALSLSGAAQAPTVNALMNLASAEETAAALDQLGAEAFADVEAATFAATATFADGLFSCPDGADRFEARKDGACVWLRSDGRVLEKDGSASDVGFRERVAGFSIGAERRLAPEWIAGLSVGYEHGTLKTDADVESSSDRYFAGGAFKFADGPYRLGAGIFGGYSDAEMTRHIEIGGLSAENRSRSDLIFVGAEARSAYLYDVGDFYGGPTLSLNAIYSYRFAATESGNPATALKIEGDDETSLSATPGVEIGFDQAIADGDAVSARLRAGVSFYAEDEHTVDARFASGASTFRSSTEVDQVVGEVEGRLSLISAAAADLEVGYLGRFSARSAQHGGFVRLSFDF